MNIRQTPFDDSFSFWLGTGIAVLILSSVILLVRRIQQKALQPAIHADGRKDLVSQRGCFVFFGGVFVIAGILGLFQMTILPAYRSMQADRWPTVNGIVTSSQIIKSSSRKKAQSRVDIHYRYVVYGKPFTSNQYDSRGTSAFSANAQQKQSIVQSHPPGKAVTVHYNPADPADAMLSTALPDGTVSSVWIALFFVGGGVFIMFLPPSAISGVKRKPVAAKATPQAAKKVDAAAVRKKRIVLALIICIAAILWNTGCLIVHFTGDFTWWNVPIALIGLYLIVISVQYVMGVFNPAIAVHFAQMPLRPGESTGVSFSVSGNLLAVRQLSFTLEGREMVTIDRGKNTSIEIDVAWRIPCYQTTRQVDMESGHFTIDLPAEAMTTFIAKHNQFTWHLICNGDIPGRPDIKDEYHVTVLPRDKRGNR